MPGRLRLSLKAGAIKHSLRDDHKTKLKAYLTLDGETDKEKKKKHFPSSSHQIRGAVNQGAKQTTEEKVAYGTGLPAGLLED